MSAAKDYDVVVLGGGPAGHAAALAAARRGATVALVEPDKPGGQCVHYACIPTAAMLSAIDAWVDVQELTAVGITEVGDFDFARAVARKEALVARVGSGVVASLRMAGVEVLGGSAAFVDAGTVAVTGDAPVQLGAEAFVIATGTRWELPSLRGVPSGKVVTADVVHTLSKAPGSALVLGGGPADTAFAVEYAYLLAAAGTVVTLALPGDRVVPALDEELEPVARGVLETFGVTVVEHTDGSDLAADVEVVLAVDVRRPSFEAARPEAAGVHTDGTVPVDGACRTNVSHVYAAGDVTGGAMVTAAASHMGDVAGTNAAGGDARTRLHHLPHALHTEPEIGWVGVSEATARAAGHDVVTALVDLSWTARAITLGGREGVLKLVAERELGEILGIHVVGPGAAEVVAAGAMALQAELTLDDVAATVHWHPGAAESLADAARAALRGTA